MDTTGGDAAQCAEPEPVLCIVGCDRDGCLAGCFADAEHLMAVLNQEGWKRGVHPATGETWDICPACVAVLRALAGEE